MKKTSLLKKVAAMVSAVALAVTMVPFVGGTKEVKAASTTYTYTYGNAGTYFTVNENSKVSPASTDYTNSTKTDSKFSFSFSVTSGKYAKVTIYAVVNASRGSGTLTVAGTGYNQSAEFTTAKNSGDAQKIILSGYITGGNDGNSCTLSKTAGTQLGLCKVEVVEYDTVLEIPADRVDTSAKVKVSGKVTSDVSLAGGTITLKGTNGQKKLYTADLDADGNYSIEDVVGKDDGTNAEYSVSIISPAILETKKNISTIAPSTISVDDSATLTKDFTINYSDITSVWNFESGLDSVTYQGASLTKTYKGLTIKTSADGGKFAVGSGNVQVNAGTTVSIPVPSGCGVKVITTNNDGTGVHATLDGNELDCETKSSKYTATAENHSSSLKNIEFVSTKNNTYIYKIEIYDAVSITPAVDDFFVQTGTNAVRFVYTVDGSVETLNASYSELGIKCTSNGVTKNITGTTVFDQVKSGETTYGDVDDKKFVVIEITGVAAGTTFTVSSIAIDKSGNEAALPNTNVYSFTTPSV